MLKEDAINKHMHEVYDILDKQHHYDVVYIGYIGAHNYNLEDETSDYDFKAIIIPTLKEVIQRKTYSEVIKYEYGQIDVKDLMSFTNNIDKGNFSYIETVRNHYCMDLGKDKIGKSIQEVYKDVKLNYMSLIGSIQTSRRRINEMHIEDGIEVYNSKALAHAIRLYNLLETSLKDKSTFEEAKISYIQFKDEDIIDLSQAQTEGSTRPYTFNRNDLIELKRNNSLSYEEGIKLLDYILSTSKQILPKKYKYISSNKQEEIITLLEKYYRGTNL